MITTIEKNVFEGSGLAHFEGQAVFIKGVVEGDVVEFSIIKKTKTYIIGKLEKIITPSKKRTEPVCPLNKVCGACDFGFINYDYQLEIKENIVKEIFKTFSDTKFLPILKSEKNLNYRMKTQYPVLETKNSKRVIIGYYKEKSHELINIKYCPIQPEIIDKITDFIRENWKLGCYKEKEHKGLLRHINLRISNYSGDILLTFVLNSDKKVDIEDFSELIISKFPQIKGVLINLNPNKTNKIMGNSTLLIKGEEYIIEKLENYIYKIGANSFFQINPKSAEIMFQNAKKLIKKRGNLLDLYGGSGVIGIFMKEKADKICLVEENKEAVKLAEENYKLNGIRDFEIINSSAKEAMKMFELENINFENVIIDPPRKGSDKESLDIVSKIAKNIIYISCNPMTLFRDSKILVEKGFKLSSIQPVDMFPNTHHIECIAHFEKGGDFA